MLFVEKTEDEKSGVEQEVKPTSNQKTEEKFVHEWDIIWRNVILYSLMHFAAFYGLYFVVTFKVSWKTVFWMLLMGWVGLQGITSGVHRLWAHKTYKATLPMRIMLMIFNTISLQQSIYDWATDHRVHHKYVDTNADPHNSLRGFFFSHVGWLFIKKHKDVETKIKAIDMSDIEADPVVMFQKEHYFTLMAPFVGFLMPAAVPWYFWGENFVRSFFVATMLRYCITTHITFTVNSVAHMFGTRPYDKNLRPVENLTVAILTGGEGWHNYHHTFPWDYRAGEFGYRYRTNTTTALIDLFAKIGWAYDMKTVSEEMIKARITRTGDGTRQLDKIDRFLKNPAADEHEDGNLWGWGDDDMTKEELDLVKVHHKAE